MLDITKIQPFDVPPELKTLELENLNLKNENSDLLSENKFIAGVIIFSFLMLGLTSYINKISQIDDNQKEI